MNSEKSLPHTLWPRAGSVCMVMVFRRLGVMVDCEPHDLSPFRAKPILAGQLPPHLRSILVRFALWSYGVAVLLWA